MYPMLLLLLLSGALARPGGWYAADPASQEIQGLLHDFYLPSTGLTTTDLELTAVEQQVVAGTNYRLTFNLQAADSQCHVTIFSQPWTKTMEITEDSCVSQVVVVHSIDGGWTQGDVNDPLVQILLEEVYFPSSGLGAEDLQLVRVETQVVAGVNYRMTFQKVDSDETCQVTIFTQEWTNTKQVAMDTCNPIPVTYTHVPMPGGWMEGDASDPSIQSLLEEVYFPSSVLGAEDLQLVRVETQVVAGVNYRMSFQKADSDETCQVTIFVQEWSNTKHVAMDTCNPTPVTYTHVTMPGGWMDGDASDPSIQSLLEEVYFPSSELGAEDVQLVRVETQLVAGMNYRMTFSLAENGEECHVIIFLQPWTSMCRVTQDTCDVASPRLL